MNIEIRNYKVVHGHDDSNPFVAKLYIDGVHAADLEDDGWGGGINVTVRNKVLFDKADAFIKAKNEVYLDMSKYGKANVMLDLNTYIDTLADEKAREIYAKQDEQRHKARLKRYFKNHIVTGVVGSEQFTVYKFNQPLAVYMQSQKGIEVLKKNIDNIKTKLSDGAVILNDNLGDLI